MAPPRERKPDASWRIRAASQIFAGSRRFKCALMSKT